MFPFKQFETLEHDTTQKNLKPVQGNLNICEYEWAIASFDFFDAA